MSDHLARNIRPDLLDYLFGLTLHGVKLGLHNISKLLEAAGNPHRAYSTIHVAGTNGKGSVAAFLDAMLRAAGYRTGKFTSPHLLDLSERFQVDGAPIPVEALEENIEFFRKTAEAAGFAPTFFEACTAVAFRWFQQSAIDVGVIEVGMGGRLDSTNVIAPLVSLITNIDLEHTQYLGSTLAQIAFEKAGVLKPGTPAVTGETREEPLAVIAGRADALKCPLTIAGCDFSHSVEGGPWEQRLSYASPGLSIYSAPLGLPGRYQADNAALAVAAAERLRGPLPRLTEEAICRGLAEAHWPCRLERVLEAPPVIVDVAHNVAGVRRLIESVEHCVTILGVASDKDAAGMIELLAPRSHPLILTAFSGKRALPVEDLRRAAGQHPCETVPTLSEALERGMEYARPGLPLLITGSIYTAGEARRMLVERYGALPLQF
jgi:dihydrofolate synthase/folylpolyglutamate synthase